MMMLMTIFLVMLVISNGNMEMMIFYYSKVILH